MSGKMIRTVCPNHQLVDEIMIRTVPRLKTSSASGDEWRIKAVAEFKYKGIVLHTQEDGSVEELAMRLVIGLQATRDALMRMYPSIRRLLRSRGMLREGSEHLQTQKRPLHQVRPKTSVRLSQVGASLLRTSQLSRRLRH